LSQSQTSPLHTPGYIMSSMQRGSIGSLMTAEPPIPQSFGSSANMHAPTEWQYTAAESLVAASPGIELESVI